jgi:hypothetical protein
LYCKKTAAQTGGACHGSRETQSQHRTGRKGKFESSTSIVVFEKEKLDLANASKVHSRESDGRKTHGCCREEWKKKRNELELCLGQQLTDVKGTLTVTLHVGATTTLTGADQPAEEHNHFRSCHELTAPHAPTLAVFQF